eukprot:122068-Pelagomonas_calceolata.AAC.5
MALVSTSRPDGLVPASRLLGCSSGLLELLFLPDKAIDLIDEAGSRVRLRHIQLPEEARDLDKELKQVGRRENAVQEVGCCLGGACLVDAPAKLLLSQQKDVSGSLQLASCTEASVTKDKDASVRGQDFEKAGSLRDREMELKAKIQAIIAGAKEQSKPVLVRVLPAMPLLKFAGVMMNGQAECCKKTKARPRLPCFAWTVASWLCCLATLKCVSDCAVNHLLSSDHKYSVLYCDMQAEAESVEGGGPTVTEADIANITAQWTGIPIEKVGMSASLSNTV